jgi:hypothetical protein
VVVAVVLVVPAGAVVVAAGAETHGLYTLSGYNSRLCRILDPGE